MTDPGKQCAALSDLRLALPFNHPDSQGSGLPPPGVFFGRSAAMAAVRRTLEAVAATDVPVLIQGESGTGKEVCAVLLHQLSNQRDLTGKRGGALVKVSCPALPQELLETELFGYEKGAFPGALSGRQGRVEQAHGGTLLLDEVGSLDLNVQARLLQLLQDGTFLRVGGHEVRSSRTRLVSLANRDLREQVEEGTFRLDLLYRVNALAVHLPPLRQRMEDLPDLTAFFLDRHARAFHTRPIPFSRRALDVMLHCPWPGNIRQLDNLIRSYVLLGCEDTLLEALAPEASRPSELPVEVDVSRPMQLKTITRRATRDLEHKIILKVLQANAWNRLKTARWLGISYRSLLYKLNEAGPEPMPRKRAAGEGSAAPEEVHKPPLQLLGSRLR